MSSAMTESQTWREIKQQPEIWRQWAEQLAQIAEDIRSWIKARNIREIWLCGAGSSAFIGDIVACGAPLPETVLRPIATTDLISHPDHYVRDSADILVVQFGRSGDSSESIATLDLLDTAMPKAHRLHITCNAKGVLATRKTRGSGEMRIITLPKQCCDRGFAMTSSFSTMLLTALACFLPRFNVRQSLIELAQQAHTLFEKMISMPIQPCPDRVIFLGSGPLKAAAREAALKLLELTAGSVMTQWDSPLGFRHGPKAAIRPKTSVVLFLHPDPYSMQYEHDLAVELQQQFEDIEIITIGSGAADIPLPRTSDARISAVLYILIAQIWSVQWSSALGLNVDNPFANGVLSRVVSGVRIYPWAG